MSTSDNNPLAQKAYQVTINNTLKSQHPQNIQNYTNDYSVDTVR